MRPPDAAFADARIAVLYDLLDDDRSDLDVYVALVDELGARRVLDIGCGTGTLAVRLAAGGLDVIGVDPAEASLDVARSKPSAELATWVHGDATAVAALHPAADLALMTGNVAQVFVSDHDWALTLDALHASVRPGGHLVLESRRPGARDWERWDVPKTAMKGPDGASITFSRRVTRVDLPLVDFESTVRVGGDTLRSTSTLRFRGRREIEQDLRRHAFDVVEVRDAPDRPRSTCSSPSGGRVVSEPRRLGELSRLPRRVVSFSRDGRSASRRPRGTSRWPPPSRPR